VSYDTAKLINPQRQSDGGWICACPACQKEGKEWVKDWQPFDGQQSTLPMTGDKRLHDGKEWESLVDYNVWLPPVGWREVVATGYPSWVQPTGAHDAYALGFKVKHKTKNWESTTPANVWEPGVYGWKTTV